MEDHGLAVGRELNVALDAKPRGDRGLGGRDAYSR